MTSHAVAITGRYLSPGTVLRPFDMSVSIKTLPVAVLRYLQDHFECAGLNPRGIWGRDSAVQVLR